MSFKKKDIRLIALTTGGTVTLPNGDIPTPPAFGQIDTCTTYIIGGTEALTSNFIVAMTSPADNIVIDIFWRARCTPGAFTVTILGQTVPAAYLNQDFTMKFVSGGGAFALLDMGIDFTKGTQLPGDRLVNASVNTAQLADKAVTLAKFQDVAAHSVPVRNAGTSGVLSELAIPQQSILGRVAAGLVAITAAVNGHVLKMTGGNIGFAQLDFNELAGTLANAQIPDREVALAKLGSTGQLDAVTADVATTAVTTEETLYSFTLPANYVAVTNEGIDVSFCGIFANNANNKTVRVKFAGTTYLVNAVTAAPDNLLFSGSFKVFRGVAFNDAVGKGEMIIGAVHQGIQGSKAAVNWTVANTLEITGQNGTANADDITLCHVSVKAVR